MLIEERILKELDYLYTNVSMAEIKEGYFEFVHQYDYLEFPKQLVVTYDEANAILDIAIHYNGTTDNIKLPNEKSAVDFLKRFSGYDKAEVTFNNNILTLKDSVQFRNENFDTTRMSETLSTIEKIGYRLDTYLKMINSVSERQE